jgi:hypothetical protein
MLDQLHGDYGVEPSLTEWQEIARRCNEAMPVPTSRRDLVPAEAHGVRIQVQTDDARARLP